MCLLLMTDRYKGLMVAFDHDIREDDAQAIIAAIRQLRGVAGVEPSMATGDDLIVRMRLDIEWQRRIYALLDPAKGQ